jgi:SulP family sulfate permease
LIRTSAPRVQVVVPDESFRHFAQRPEAPLCPQLGIVEVKGDLYFGAVSHIEEEILELAANNPEQRFLLIRMHHVNQVDFSGIHMLESLIDTYRDRGGDVFLVRVNAEARQLMESTGCLSYLGARNILDEDTAVDYLFHRMLDPAVCIYECPVRVFRECQNLPKRFDLIDVTPQPLPAMRPNGKDGVVSEKVLAPRDLWQQLHAKPPIQQPVVLDVREPREYRRSRIPEAQSVPLSTLINDGLDLAIDRPMVLVCQSGRRSRRAMPLLHSMGFGDISIVDGGMQAWEAAGLLTAVEFGA